MSDLERIILTATATLIGGVILFVLGEFIKLAVLIPSQRLKEHIQIALSKLDFHCNMLTNYFSANPSEEEWKIIYEIKKDLRSAATELKSSYSLLPWKTPLAKIKLIPPPGNIDTAYRGLIYLHNSILYTGRRDFIINEIEMNNNQIDRIHAALSGQTIPELLKPKEKQR